MSFDEMYDEMLHGEFNLHGKHVAKAAAVEPEPAPSPVRGRHVAADGADTAEVGTVEEPVTEAVERPRGFQRYRTAALVGAGGMACAAAGAFLGGLGGYFTVSPAAAHPLSSPTVTQDLPLAQAVSNAAHSSTASPAKGTAAVAAASFSKASGSLTQGIAPFTTLTSEPLANLPVVSLPGLPGSTTVTTGSGGTGTGTGDGSGDGSGNGGGTTGTTGCDSSSSDLGLTCILEGLTGALSNLGSLSGGDPGSLLNGLVPSLAGVVTDVTGTLENLSSLLPIASLPTGGTGGLTGVLAGAPTGVSTGAASTTGGSGSGSPASPIVSALAPVLNGIAALAGGTAAGSGSPSLPSLPLSSSSGGTSLPSLPVVSSGSTGSAPTVTTPSSGSSSGNTNTINVPIPLPLPINTPTLSIGGLSIGINTTDSGSGLTLSLP